MTSMPTDASTLSAIHLRLDPGARGGRRGKVIGRHSRIYRSVECIAQDLTDDLAVYILRRRASAFGTTTLQGSPCEGLLVVPNQVWAARRNGYLFWFNDQAFAYAGTTPGTMDGVMESGRIVDPDDLPPAGEASARSLATGDVYETEFRVRRADRAYPWFLVRAEPVRAPDGGVLR